MTTQKERALQQTLHEIQRRLGEKALDVGSVPQQAATLSTGYSELDLALEGGLQRGRLNEFMGKPTSGVTTLALKTLAVAQQEGDVAVYIDLPSTFDPHYAAQHGVKVGDMLLARPSGSIEAMDILFDSVATGLPGIVVFNAASAFSSADYTRLNTVLKRLNPTLNRSKCALLLLVQSPTSQIAAIRLRLELEDWLYAGRDVSGYRARVTVLKQKSSVSKSILITIDNIAAGDGT